MKIEKYASTGPIQIIEKIIRSHPLVYYIIRSIIRFTNIFEEDVQGVIYLNLGKKLILSMQVQVMVLNQNFLASKLK